MFKVRESRYETKRKKALELFLTNPFSSATIQNRDRLLTLCMIAVLYVKLGVRPESVFGVSVTSSTPQDISLVLMGLLTYFMYLYALNIGGDALLHKEKFGEVYGVAIRGFQGLAASSIYGFRIFMDMLFPAGFFSYALYLLGNTP